MYFGLKLINRKPRPGVNALKEIAGLKKGMEVSSIVFGFAPRINAAGRIAHAKTAVELLLSKTDEEANALSETINDRNIQRKDFDKTITLEALQMIESDEELLQAKSTVLFKEDWHKGVIGIVASRCIEKHYKPTIIFTQSNGHAAGSARSVDGFDVYEAISQCSDLLEQFGGHKYAAGLTLKVDNIPAFQKRFEEVVAASITEEQLIPQVEIDLSISFNQVNEKFYNIIKQMAPFGPRNMEPVFVSEGVYDTGQSRLLKGEHIKLHIRQKDSGPVEAIAFGMAQYFQGVSAGKPFSLCYKICENEFNGKKSLQLLVRDIKFVD
jgi:single-stranded-DNA-specific exonuclease